MRYDPLDPASRSSIARRYALDEPVAPGDWDDMPHATAALPSRRATILRWTLRGLAAGIVLLVIAIAWLAITAPLSKSLEPPTPPSITLTADDGTPIARRGAIIG
ncbi:MAG TPA: penicillin-binding protein, partial [Sphingomonas sp.]